MTIAAIRFNNPGNVSLPIRGYSGPGEVVGISGQSGYASFPTMQDGLNAQSARLTSYINNGVGGSGPLTTIADLNTKYAQDPNWKYGVSANSGIGINTPLDTSNTEQMSALQGGIIRQETGKDPSVFGFGTTAPMNTNDPTSLTGTSGLSAPANAGALSGGAGYAQSNGSGNYYYNPETGAVTPTTDTNPPGTTEGFGMIDSEKGILYGGGTGPYSSGLPGGTGVPTTGFDSTGGFTALNAGTMGSTPGSVTALGAPATSSPFSLQGATLDKSVTAQSVAGSGDPVVGYNSAGPVIGAPTVTAAINQSGQKVSGSVDKGSQQIGSDVKTAGQTVGQSITGAAKTAQGISDSWQSLGKDYFARLVFIVIGLIAIAAALMMFKPVQQVAASVASKVPKVPV